MCAVVPGIAIYAQRLLIDINYLTMRNLHVLRSAVSMPNSKVQNASCFTVCAAEISCISVVVEDKLVSLSVELEEASKPTRIWCRLSLAFFSRRLYLGFMGGFACGRRISTR